MALYSVYTSKSNRTQMRKVLVILIAVMTCGSMFVLDFSKTFAEPVFNYAFYFFACLFGSYAYSKLLTYAPALCRVEIIHHQKITIKTAKQTCVYLLGPKPKIYLMSTAAFIRLSDGTFVRVAFQDRKKFIQSLQDEGLEFQSVLLPAIVVFVFPYLILVRAPHGDYGFAAIALIAIAAFGKYSAKPEQKKIRSKLLFQRYRNDWFKRVAASTVLGAASLVVSLQPLSAVDRSFKDASTAYRAHPNSQNIAFLRSLAEQHPTADYLNQAAWSLATSPDESLRDYPAALQLAEKAVSLDRPRYIRDTLACALMANQQVDKAIELAKKIHSKERVELFSQGKLCSDPAVIRTPASLQDPIK